VRIPLIIKWPRESSSLEIPLVVSQMDIFPTMLDAAGMEPLEGWATNLRRYVDGASPPPNYREVSNAKMQDLTPTIGFIRPHQVRQQQSHHKRRRTPHRYIPCPSHGYDEPYQ
jgi:arylsulfatase A-like enzyme